MRGLPFSATKGDIKAFFEGFNVSDAGIYLVAGKGGRPSGEAFVQFGDEYEAQRALLKDKEAIGMRWVCVGWGCHQNSAFTKQQLKKSLEWFVKLSNNKPPPLFMI